MSAVIVPQTIWRTLNPPPGKIYVVGDLHGCLLEVETLLAFLNDRVTAEDQVVFLGDYLDRGPNSSGVIEALINLRKHLPNVSFLMGNHEEMFLNFLAGPRVLEDPYLAKFGGRETFESYQMPLYEVLEDPESHLPKEHLDFIRSGEVAILCDQWLLAHAGVRPTVPLEQQTARDLMWIRDEFISKPHELGKTVIFGHTPMKEILAYLPFGVGIDTGVVYGNKLTCLELTSGAAYQIAAGETRILKSQVW